MRPTKGTAPTLDKRGGDLTVSTPSGVYVLNRIPLPKRGGPCPHCGAMKVHLRHHAQQVNPTNPEYWCAGCGRRGM